MCFAGVSNQCCCADAADPNIIAADGKIGESLHHQCARARGAFPGLQDFKTCLSMMMIMMIISMMMMMITFNDDDDDDCDDNTKTVSIL